MNKKRIIALLLFIAIVLSFTACGVAVPIESPDAEPSEQSQETENELFTRGTEISLAEDSSLEITRSLGDVQPKEPPQDGIWTVFVYMCGTDLESNYGSATGDIEEMRAATAQTSNLRFAVMAGGTRQWHNDYCTDGTVNFLTIENGKVTYEDSTDGNMGDVRTLYDFLCAGLERHESQYIMLDLWDHGGGSLNGICFDECYGSDSLSLVEIDKALSAAFQKTRRKFDIIGFDACLMATVETANILVPYGNYMLASEELEPGSGWYYTAIGNSLANGAQGGEELGRDMITGYFQSLGSEDKYRYTMSLVDLSKIDTLLKSLNSFSIDIYDSIYNHGGLDTVLKGAKSVSSFGSGKYNMLDLGELVSANSGSSNDAQHVLDLLNEAVVYMENGEKYADARGLSVYFPTCRPERGALNALKNICVTPYYMAVVDVCAYGKDTLGALEGYDPGQWIEDNGAYWSDEELDDSEYDYWADESEPYELNGDYDNIAVKFEVEPHIGIETTAFFFASADAKVITFTVSNESVEKLAAVYDNYYMEYLDPDTGKTVYLGLGVKNKYDNSFVGGSVSDALSYTMLDGIKYPFSEEGYPQIKVSCIRAEQLTLPDGKFLSEYPAQLVESQNSVDSQADPLELSKRYSPVLYNGVNAVLVYGRFDYYQAPMYVLVDEENGMSSRIMSLEAGDVIRPVYPAYDPDSMEFLGVYYGEEYVCVGGNGDYVTEKTALEGDGYKYSMTIEDVYGNTVDTPMVSLHFYSDDEQVGHTESYDIIEDSFSQGTETNAPHYDENGGAYYNVRLNVSCVENVSANKYDVDILIDEQYFDTLAHGKAESYALELGEGEHTLEFRINGKTAILEDSIYDPEDDKTFSRWTLKVNGNWTFSFIAKMTANNTIDVEYLS